MEQREVIELGDKLITLKLVAFDTDIDTDDVLKIDYHNIMGEILTFPVIMNRLGNIKAEQEEIVALAKMDFEIYEAKLAEKYRKELSTPETKTVKNIATTTIKKPTKDEVDNAVIMDEGYRLKKSHLYRLQRNLAYLDSLYWSAKSKDDKLNKLSDKLHPSEFEGDILNGTINGVLIKVRDKLIK